MKHLHDKVNIVPVIAKADTLTPSELRKLKDRVREINESNEISLYDCAHDVTWFIQIEENTLIINYFFMVSNNPI